MLYKTGTCCGKSEQADDCNECSHSGKIGRDIWHKINSDMCKSESEVKCLFLDIIEK